MPSGASRGLSPPSSTVCLAGGALRPASSCSRPIPRHRLLSPRSPREEAEGPLKPRWPRLRQRGQPRRELRVHARSGRLQKAFWVLRVFRRVSAQRFGPFRYHPAKQPPCRRLGARGGCAVSPFAQRPSPSREGSRPTGNTANNRARRYQRQVVLARLPPRVAETLCQRLRRRRRPPRRGFQRCRHRAGVWPESTPSARLFAASVKWCRVGSMRPVPECPSRRCQASS